MDKTEQNLTFHPQLFTRLFAYQAKAHEIFNDVMALYEISHIAITHINSNHQLMTVSSTPSLEYNLLSSPLWRFDNTYSAHWFKQGGHASWQSLYAPERYDELYYIKQTKPHYPLGISIAKPREEGYLIYSIASSTESDYTRDIFTTQQDKLYKVGQYCTTYLWSLLTDNDTLSQ